MYVKVCKDSGFDRVWIFLWDDENDYQLQWGLSSYDYELVKTLIICVYQRKVGYFLRTEIGTGRLCFISVKWGRGSK